MSPTEPLDDTHRMCIAAQQEIRTQFDVLYLDVADWDLTEAPHDFQ